MIKFFRKIRQDLLNKGKTTTYFKYAIGEIILVVIGVLIAVWINGKYNDAENEKKIETILVQVQKELLTDIKEAKRIFGVYMESDSLSRSIINDKVTPEVVKNDRRFIYFMNRAVSFSNKKTGYERFMQNLENLPKKYNILLPYFNNLFRELQHEIDDRNTDILNFSRLQKQSNTYKIPHNYLLYSGQLPEEDVKTILNNPYLKNISHDHILFLGSTSLSANKYRVLSIELYKKIDSLLGTQPNSYPDILHTIPEKEDLKTILGKYTEIKNTNPASISLSFKENHIEVNHSIYGKRKIYWNGDDYYFIDHSFPYFIYKPYKNEKGQQVWEGTNGIIKRVYIKTSDLNL